jgi:hypothetical protein
VIASGTRRQPRTPGGTTLSNLLDNHRPTFTSSFLLVTWGTYVDVFVREEVREDIRARSAGRGSLRTV